MNGFSLEIKTTDFNEFAEFVAGISNLILDIDAGKYIVVSDVGDKLRSISTIMIEKLNKDTEGRPLDDEREDAEDDTEPGTKV